MDRTATILLIFGGAALIFIIASGVLETFKRRQGASARIIRIEDRIASWWVIWFVLLLAVLIGPYGTLVLFGLCSFAVLREFLSLLDFERGDHWSLLATVFAILPVQFALASFGYSGLFLIFIPVYAVSLLPIVSALRGSAENFLNRISQYQWGMMICIYAMSYIPALLFLDIGASEDRMLAMVLFLIAIVETAKALQHVISLRVSAPLLAPQLSKTRNLAGFFGAVAISGVIGVILSPFTIFSPFAAFFMSMITAAIGLLGSLVITAIKRDRGVAVFDRAISGHGGFLDGFDSLLFAAPIFYHLTRYFYAMG